MLFLPYPLKVFYTGMKSIKYIYAGGILQPAASALLHNTSTLAVSVKSMGNLLE